MHIGFHNISKSFPGVRALQEVSFEIGSGACHALLGENGAGKSTLGKILAGLYRPDAGEIRLDGQPVRLGSPREALSAGVGIVHQELMFCSELSIAENLFLHDLPGRGWRLDRTALRDRARRLLDKVQLDVDPGRRLGDLSIAQEQLVQIAGAVGLGARVLVFDEPTSSLGRAETQNLFSLIAELRRGGTTIVYVSHRLEEVFAICETATVLRDGRHVATRATSELDPAEIVRLMVGRRVETIDAGNMPERAIPPLLSTRGLTLPGRFEAIDLEVRAGEILGLAGLVGAGRSEVGETIAGLNPGYHGEITLAGKRVELRSPARALELGIGLVPEDRKRQGLVLGMAVRENVTLSVLDRLQAWLGWLNRGEERRITVEAGERLRIRSPGIDTVVGTLSGGNQQKVVFARAWARRCQVLVIDEPTRGVDVGAKREIHELILELARGGTAIVLISSDLPELLALAHRLLVLKQGRRTALIERGEATEERVASAMTGLADCEAGPA